MRKLLVALYFVAAAAHAQTWTVLGPAARYGHTAVFDSITGKMIVFGGTGPNGPYNDAWASTAYKSGDFDLKWTQVIGSTTQNPGSHADVGAAPGKISRNATEGTAPPRSYSPAVFWSAHDQIILWGGLIYHAGQDWYDSHEFNLDTKNLAWTHDGPRSRQAHTAVYDPDTNSMIIFGGSHSPAFGAINDTYVTPVSAPNEDWQGGLSLVNAPPPVYGHVAGYNPANQTMVVATGATGTGQLAPCLNGAWQELNANRVGTPSWVQPAVTGTPPSTRAFAAAFYDSVSDSLTIFGGTDCNGHYLQDLWTLNGATSTAPYWTERSTQGKAPGAREGATAVYDPGSNTLVLFGGDEGTKAYLRDVWTLSNANGAAGSSTWTKLTPAGPAPSARSGQWTVYDPTTNTMYIGSGSSASGLLADTWQLTGANGLSGTPAWTELATSGNLPSTQAPAILAEGSIITFGGQVPTTDYFSATYDITSVLVVN